MTCSGCCGGKEEDDVVAKHLMFCFSATTMPGQCAIHHALISPTPQKKKPMKTLLYQTTYDQGMMN